MKALIQPQMSKILDDTTGVVLLGTPHRGTDNVTSGELLQRILRAGAAGEAASLTVLRTDNEMVLDAVHSFSTITREKDIPVHCFFEQKSSKVSKMFGDDYKDFIVDEKSAILDGCESYGLPLDHYQLNKFSDPEDGNWKQLSGVITDLCDNTDQVLAKRNNGMILDGYYVSILYLIKIGLLIYQQINLQPRKKMSLEGKGKGRGKGKRKTKETTFQAVFLPRAESSLLVAVSIQRAEQ